MGNPAEESKAANADPPAGAAPADPSPAEADVPRAEAAPDVSGEPPPEGAAAKPKKKKKRKKEPTGPSRDPLGPDGRERPAFVLDYPSDPDLDRLVQAFELGNYAYVREHAPGLAEKGKDARIRAAATELGRRIEPDPLVKVLIAMSLGLLFVLALWAYLTHGN